MDNTTNVKRDAVGNENGMAGLQPPAQPRSESMLLKPKRIEPALPGSDLPVPVVTNLEVSQGVDGIFSTFDLGFEGSGTSNIRTYLNPETLGIDHDRMTHGRADFLVAHEMPIDRQIQQQCKERGIEPLIKLEEAQDWVSKTLGGDFEILRFKAGVQLQGAGGIWTQKDSITEVIDHIENRLIDDLHFLKDVGRAVGYPEKLRNDQGMLDYRHSAYVRSKIESAMENRPDEISVKIQELEEEFSEVFSKNPSIKL